MLKKSLSIKKIFFLFPGLLFMPACYLNLTGVNTGFNLPSVGDNFAPSDSEFFYIDLDVDTYENNDEIVPYYDISTTEEYGDSVSRKSPSNCEIEYISSDDETERHSTETIVCILDIPEFEFAAKDFHIVYNFPEGMCEYTSVALPWHLNYEIHQGPVVKECEDDPDTEAEETGFSCDTPGISTCDGTCYKDENDLCPGGPGEPPCCVGGEKSDGQKWEESDPEAFKECFGGPGTIVAQFPDFYRKYITALPEGGLRRTITLPHLLSFNGEQRTTAPYANYLRRLDLPPEDLQTLNRRNLPEFLQRSHYKFLPRLFFEFSCLDSAHETLHQIFLMIREWNTFEEFIAFYDSGGDDEGDPDVEGREGRDCHEAQERWTLDNEYERCNDESDLDNYSGYPKILYGRWQGDNGSE